MEYEVTWTVVVNARSPHEAAQKARARMIDPSKTQATFEVQPWRDAHSTRVIVVDDPDKSNL